MSGRPPVVLVHGMYMNSASWQPWVERGTERGWDVHAPSWPFHEGEPAQLREHLDPALGKLTFGAVTDHFKQLIDALPQRPLLVGHSIGGLQVQKLLADGYGAAGVAISPAPPRGVVTLDPTFFRANWPHTNPFAGSKPIAMTHERFHYAFCNSLSRADSDALWEAYTVPESRNVPRSTLTGAGAIDFRKDGPPMLIITGDQDHLTPVGLVRRNHAAYGRGPRAVELEVVPGRSHVICNEPGWEQVADRAFGWLEARAGA